MNKDFFKSSNPSRFHSLRDTRPEPTTWQVLFKEITNSTHTTAAAYMGAADLCTIFFIARLRF
jgi:hypothetical protein